MIFCSRRVFLNVVTQLMDAPTLLNANYFIVDQPRPDARVQINDIPKMGEDGSVVFEPDLDFANIPEPVGMHQYFITYSTAIDPQPYFGIVTASGKNDFRTPEEKFAQYLMQTDVQIRIYQDIYQKKLEGNGLQILIMNSDYGVELCGHLICSFLAEVFGSDVTFIDPKYRPKTKGQLQYTGNKAYAEQHIRELRDFIFLKYVDSLVDMSRFGGSLNNLMTMPIFSNPDVPMEDLFHAYNLLFPQDPLPAGNYTREHLRQIIIGRLTNATGLGQQNQTFKNLGVDLYAFDPCIRDYDSQLEEDFSDIS